MYHIICINLPLPGYCWIQSKPCIVHNVASVGKENLADSPFQCVACIVMVQLQDLVLDRLIQLRVLLPQTGIFLLLDQSWMFPDDDLPQLNVPRGHQSQPLPLHRAELVRSAVRLVTLPVAPLTGAAAVPDLTNKCISKEHPSDENTTFRYLIFERKLELSVPHFLRQDQGQRIKVEYSS